jgi:hypothetical protein
MSVLEYTSQVLVFQSSRTEQASRRSIVQWIVYPFSRLFGCWHRNMSRPFTRDGRTYCVCLGCGRRRNFDLETWRMSGGYYTNDPSVASKVKSATIKKVVITKGEKFPKVVSNATPIQSWQSTMKGRMQ